MRILHNILFSTLFLLSLPSLIAQSGPYRQLQLTYLDQAKFGEFLSLQSDLWNGDFSRATPMAKQMMQQVKTMKPAEIPTDAPIRAQYEAVQNNFVFWANGQKQKVQDFLQRFLESLETGGPDAPLIIAVLPIFRQYLCSYYHRDYWMLDGNHFFSEDFWDFLSEKNKKADHLWLDMSYYEPFHHFDMPEEVKQQIFGGLDIMGMYKYGELTQESATQALKEITLPKSAPSPAIQVQLNHFAQLLKDVKAGKVLLIGYYQKQAAQPPVVAKSTSKALPEFAEKPILSVFHFEKVVEVHAIAQQLKAGNTSTTLPLLAEMVRDLRDFKAPKDNTYKTYLKLFEGGTKQLDVVKAKRKEVSDFLLGYLAKVKGENGASEADTDKFLSLMLYWRASVYFQPYWFLQPRVTFSIDFTAYIASKNPFWRDFLRGLQRGQEPMISYYLSHLESSYNVMKMALASQIEGKFTFLDEKHSPTRQWEIDCLATIFEKAKQNKWLLVVEGVEF